MAVLYRKYRPQTFGQVLNQKSIIQTLKNQVTSGSVAHAYLFTGSRGVGKTSVARILAKAVNCLKRLEYNELHANDSNADACGECDVCKAVEAGNFLDLVEIDAASNTGVDNIRDLIEHVKFSPSLGKYKVFIIDEVHMLSKGAFNALLKTLEEPPKHAIFIFATTEINKVPATIISRTQRFDFKAYSAADLLPLLQKIAKAEQLEFSDEVLELIAQNAEGSARDALSLLDKLMSLGGSASLEESEALLGITDTAVCENLLGLISAGQAKALPEFFQELSAKALDFKIFNRDFLEYLRKALVFKISQKKDMFGSSVEHQNKLEQLSAAMALPDLIFIIRLFLRSYKELDSSPSPEIPLLLSALEAALKKSADSSKLAAVSRQVSPQPASPIVESVKNSQVVEEIIQSAVSKNSSTLSLEQITEFWPKALAKIKEINSPLASMLRAVHLEAVENGRLILGVKFMFDKQSLENAKNTSLVCGTIEELTGQKIGLLARVLKSSKDESVDSALVLSEALKVFGGELIE